MTLNATASGFTAAIHAATTPARRPATASPNRPVAQTVSAPQIATDSRAKRWEPNRNPAAPNRRSTHTGPARASGKPGARIARRGKTPLSMAYGSPAARSAARSR